jgi:hypothetical protein
MHRLLVLAVGFASTIALSSCFGSLNGTRDEALKVETALHQQMANGDFAGIYNNADQSYRNAITREKSDALFKAIGQKLGTPVTCGQEGVFISATTSGTFIRSVCKTPFSKDASAVETFMWKKSGDEYKLSGYNINSDELIER